MSLVTTRSTATMEITSYYLLYSASLVVPPDSGRLSSGGCRHSSPSHLLLLMLLPLLLFLKSSFRTVCFHLNLTTLVDRNADGALNLARLTRQQPLLVVLLLVLRLHLLLLLMLVLALAAVLRVSRQMLWMFL